MKKIFRTVRTKLADLWDLVCLLASMLAFGFAKYDDTPDDTAHDPYN